MNSRFLTLCSILFAFNAHSSKEMIVYGEDGRKNYFEVSKKLKSISESVGGIFFKDQAIDIGKRTMLNPKSLGKSMRLCKDEKFYKEPSAVSCTFFLVAKDLVVTAGHCVDGKDACKSLNFVFDYKVESKNEKTKILVDNSKVYTCKKVINTKLESKLKKNAQGKNEVAHTLDFALVKLDREVTDREPLKLRFQGRKDIENFTSIKLSTPLLTIGHPSGLPLKITDGAKVTENDNKNYFIADLDTFGGNSGSPVFNANNLEVVGILVRGQADYIKDELNKCMRVNQLESVLNLSGGSKDRGEAVSNIYQVKELYQ